MKDGLIDRAAPVRRPVRTRNAKKRFRLSTEPLLEIVQELWQEPLFPVRSARPERTGHGPCQLSQGAIALLRHGLDQVALSDAVGGVAEEDVSHLGATPLGDEVTYKAVVTAVDGRKITFDVEAVDSRETVGRGAHERYVIDVERFARGLKKKFGQVDSY